MELDRPKKALAAFVRWVMRDVDYLAPYPSEVQSQDADGLVDVYPDDERIRGSGLSKVPIWLGVPGTVRVPSGARCVLRFQNGDPGKPYVAAFGGSALTELKLGSGAQFAALANLVDQRFTALENAHNALVTQFNSFGTAFQTHIHPVAGVLAGGATVPSAPTVTPAPPASSLSPGSSVAASKVKVE